MFGNLLGKLVTLPIRIVNAPIKGLDALFEDSQPQDNALDEAAKAIEDEFKKIDK